MKIKMILPALMEAKSPLWRHIKYSLFPPSGLAILAAYCSPDDHIDLQDEHVEELNIADQPEVVLIRVYITNAFRSYALADHCHLPGSQKFSSALFKGMKRMNRVFQGASTIDAI